jgi:hypothetical protein
MNLFFLQHIQSAHTVTLDKPAKQWFLLPPRWKQGNPLGDNPNIENTPEYEEELGNKSRTLSLDWLDMSLVRLSFD